LGTWLGSQFESKKIKNTPFHDFKELKFFVAEILKSQEIFSFLWDGQERVSKLVDLEKFTCMLHY
jgi:hypothetical protein